ncbi:MAG: hypothetical protein U0Q03_03095 [Acidimicrobiales bacterium]
MTAAPPLGTPVGTPPTIGVLGRDWRATVTPWGAVQQWDDLGTLDWFVAADDRWHVPADEPTVRQTLDAGTPVVETRVRIPSGDAIQRVYAAADHGGITVIEVENDSPLPIAVAFAGARVLSQRPPTDMPIQGIDLPAGAVVFPIGHHATLTVGVAHDPASALARSGQLPAELPPRAQVARAWLAAAERASRLLVPDTTLASCVVRERCRLMLDGPPPAADQPIEFLLAVGDLVRMGSVAEAWIPELADAVAALPTHRDDPLLAAAIDAAARVCVAARETRAVKDLQKVRSRLGVGAGAVDVPAEIDDIRGIAALERSIAAGTDLFPGGIPTDWLGQNFEVYGVPTGPAGEVSFALRWHGERPAVLWECTGEPVTLTSSGAAPGWSTTERTGETLWPAPAGATAATASPTHATLPIVPPGSTDVSFN